MRDLRELNHYRFIAGEQTLAGGNPDPSNMGVFMVSLHRDAPPLRILASSGMGWDHVSVSLANRCPTWNEMERVKRLFFRDDETAMQLHVPPSDHKNCHPCCLHLWRPHDAEIPRPPSIMVAL